MNYKEWESTIPNEIREDLLWKVEAYRLALFASEIGWRDVTKLSRDMRTRDLSNQLYDALGSVAANIEEGYSRRSGKDRALFFGYSLGSARESRGWYFRGRHVLGDTIATHRIKLLTSVIRLLLVMVPDQRAMKACEDEAPYGATVVKLEDLLIKIPMPNDESDS